MHYLFADIHRLMSGVPFTVLAKPKSALHFLMSRVEAGDELSHFLAEYPRLRCEPLDFHYVCQQSLSVLTNDLMADLLQYHAGHGIFWAAFLGALSGDSSYLAPVLAARATDPHYQWVVDLAVAILTSTNENASFPHRKPIIRLREQLQPLPLLEVRLRRAPSQAEHAAAAAHVRSAYQSRLNTQNP
ncbi:hypothetical protein HGP17_28665 [Rhizobium sp. P38BS-XIX]|uniref:hypothetical protein n=1 Tax=Rhizobium sp. P38BS-XIX TaxID=2726740 RepID=UPI0014572913|nr:hypothetical protein [Rhizobium sp. P38BS-XIX]NLS00821.1 hypothetical protein [Rhizobium sp. P38BS-XIX]